MKGYWSVGTANQAGMLKWCVVAASSCAAAAVRVQLSCGLLVRVETCRTGVPLYITVHATCI